MKLRDGVLILATTTILAVARLGLGLPEHSAVSDAAPSINFANEIFTTLDQPSAPTAEIASSYRSTQKTTATLTTSTSSINLGSAERVSTTGVDASSGVKIYHKMLYGHSTKAFGTKVKRLSVGSTFTVTIDGQTATYRIANRAIYAKDVLNSNTNLRLSIYNYSGLTLMTCGNGGNDDANYRLVLWAEPV